MALMALHWKIKCKIFAYNMVILSTFYHILTLNFVQNPVKILSILNFLIFSNRMNEINGDVHLPDVWDTNIISNLILTIYSDFTHLCGMIDTIFSFLFGIISNMRLSVDKANA